MDNKHMEPTCKFCKIQKNDCSQKIIDSITDEDLQYFIEKCNYYCWIVLAIKSEMKKQDLYDVITLYFSEELSETSGTFNEDYPDFELVIDIIDKECSKTFKKWLVKKLVKFADRLDIS